MHQYYLQRVLVAPVAPGMVSDALANFVKIGLQQLFWLSTVGNSEF